MADIARLARVSASTVSRALNDSPALPQATKDRILRIVEEQNYQLDTRAQNFRLQRSNTIATVFPYYGTSQRLLSDPFYLEILAAITDELANNGHDMILARVPTSDDAWCKRYVLNSRVDGLILIDRATDDPSIKTLRELGANFVVWGAQLTEQTYVSVGCNSKLGATMAVRHLVRLGRRRIAFIGGSQFMVETDQRWAGYCAGLDEAGLPLDDNLYAFTDFSPQASYHAMNDLLKRAPDVDAVFLCSDFMAITALEVLRESGRRVPDDVSVVGYDDISLAAHCSPRLTTIHQQIQEGGRLMVKKLYELMDNQPTESAMLPVELIVRDSCGAKEQSNSHNF